MIYIYHYISHYFESFQINLRFYIRVMLESRNHIISQLFYNADVVVQTNLFISLYYFYF
jgi:hypothetical protein